MQPTKPSTMMYATLLLITLFSSSVSFSPVCRQSVARSAPISSAPTVRQTIFEAQEAPDQIRRRSSFLFAAEDPQEPDEKESTALESESKNQNKDGSSRDVERSLITSILVAVPLFFKFVVVLLIKFLTDLVVFPLLFLYRMVGVAKRKVLGLFGKGKINGGDPVNGASE